MMGNQQNIILTGMPGAGKSTVGVLLAKQLGRYFLDTDIYIQTLEDKYLQQIIDEQGLETFCKIEERHLLCIDCTNAVIATGGSAVYSASAMNHLKSNGVALHLDLSLEQIKRRIAETPARGIVIEPGETIESLYEKRLPLYRKWADITIDCYGLSAQQVADRIISSVNVDRSG